MFTDNRSLRCLVLVLVVSTFIAVSLALHLNVANAQKGSLIPVIPPGSAYRQTNFLSDVPGFALLLDPLLVNPWGITVRGTSPFWIANNATSTTQLVRGDVAGAPVTLNPAPQTITIPGGLPTGTVGNPTTDFKIMPPGGGALAASSFIFASITGNIAAWNAASGTAAQVIVSMPGHVYTGLAIGSNSTGNKLYAADFANNHVDVFSEVFAPTTVTGGFADPSIPAGYAPFNIQNLGGLLYVAYAKVGPDGRSEDGVGFGYVRRFNTDGVRDLTFLIDQGELSAPWGLTIAPASFGIFGGALLVGNFGEGNASIHAYNPATGATLGADNSLHGESGEGIEIDELWALQFGNGGSGGDVNTLYFTAGPGEEEHGLFGKLQPTTASATSLIQFASSDVGVSESGGHVDITVIRLGNTSGTATVNFDTFDESQVGHASQKSDFEIALGKITFAPGESSKTFRILVVDDKFVEDDETIDLFLTNPTGSGVGLGTTTHSEVTIFDDDTAPSDVNLAEVPSFFVRQLYLDMYNREPDAAASGLAGQISACGFTLSCSRKKRVEIGETFFNSSEFGDTGSLVVRSFRTAFGPNRFGSPGDVLYGEFEEAMQAILNGVPIPGGASELEANKVAFFNRFVTRPDFVAKYPASLTNAAYVDALLPNTGTTFPAGFRDFLVAGLDGGTITRAQAVRAIAEHPTFASNDQKRDIVQMAYFAFMRRDPDTAAFNTMLARLNSITFDPYYDTVRIFIGSSEYTQRFSAGVFAPGGLINIAPIAVENTIATAADTPISIPVVTNDVDVDGDFLTVASVTAGTGGTVTINPDGRSVTFTPSSGFIGVATFQYTVTDNGTRMLPFTPFSDPKTDTTTVFIGVGVTAPNANVSGTLYSSTGQLVPGAFVLLTGPTVKRVALTNIFGTYRFYDVPIGQSYTISASAKSFSFPPKTVVVNDFIADVDLIASP